MTGDAAILEGALADRSSWQAGDRCPIAKALQVVGTRSAILILREAYYGTTRFDDFARRVGITEAVAAARLRELTDVGIFDRQPYREDGKRTRHEYRLTEMGRDLLPAVLGLFQWGSTYLTSSGRAPLDLRHAGCGSSVQVSVHCEDGHEVPLDQLTIAAPQRGSRAVSRRSQADRRSRAQ